METPQIVLDAAHKIGYDKVEYIGTRDGALVFSLAYDDEITMPTGLPTVAVVKGGKISIIDGLAALDLL